MGGAVYLGFGGGGVSKGKSGGGEKDFHMGRGLLIGEGGENPRTTPTRGEKLKMLKRGGKWESTLNFWKKVKGALGKTGGWGGNSCKEEVFLA